MNEEELKIKENKAMCLKCETIIESIHRHDFVRCPCGNLFVDGGKAYLRRGAADIAQYLDLSTYEEDE
jgi:hypothetical protein